MHGKRRHHVRRFALRNKIVQGVNINFGIADNVGNNIFSARRFIKRNNRSIFYAVKLSDNVFNFGKFDAKAAYLNLKINSSVKFQIAVVIVFGKVARVINFNFFVADFNFIKFFCGKFGAFPISRRKLRTCQTKFANFAERQKFSFSFLVDDKRRAVVKRSADWNRIIFFALLKFKIRRVDSKFSRSVSVENFAANVGDACHCLAAQTNIINVKKIFCRQYLSESRRIAAARDFMFGNKFLHFKNIMPRNFRNNKHCAACH